MFNRTKLHEMLIAVSSNDTHVYFQPPQLMKFPCIVYKLADDAIKYANDSKYISKYNYEITLIENTYDNSILPRLLQLSNSRLIENYITNGKYHYIINIEI